MAGVLDIVLDNPILTKHSRSRLRRNRVVPWSIVVVTLCAVICWVFYQQNGLLGTTPLTMVIMLQVVALVFAGAGEIGGSVGGARESGILDFHRVSPVPPLWLAIGFFFGAPLLEYWLTLLTMPFAIFLAVIGPVGWQGLAAFEFPLLLAAWLVHTLTLLGAMVSKKPKAGNRGLIGLVIFGLFMGQGIFFGIQFFLFDLAGQMATIRFFGLPVPWMVLVVAYEAILIGFLFIPSVRRMRSDRIHLFSKPQAIAFLVTIVTLVLGVTWSLRGYDFLVVSLLYALVFVAILLAVTVTPDRSEYIKGLRRAIRMGRKRPSPWADPGANRLSLFVLCAVVLLGTTVAWEVVEGRERGGPSAYSQTIAIGVLTIAYVGLGLQAAQLYMRKHGHTLFALFLFFAWIVPLVIAGGLAAGQFDPQASLTSAALSPLAGIMISTGLMEDAGPAFEVGFGPPRVAAVGSALTFTFLFHFLLDVVQRRLDRAVRDVSARRDPDPFDDILGVPGAQKDPELADPGGAPFARAAEGLGGEPSA
ncbi:hypothetical protein [Tautonia plasticadhaerens]|uniref:Uncharacterized protein n=1 Tax=Tautonia plasticadhaerens TaxID=2527974 RepID=A0A518H128_9BACT|nr:hypothetical protein [Tautonia plasticadhaerens]QDV34559.1 hypothetical protein ElP_24490 [Tautonia plasticadhaerens]